MFALLPEVAVLQLPAGDGVHRAAQRHCAAMVARRTAGEDILA